MKIKALIFAGGTLITALGMAADANFPLARITLHVVGEDSSPISGANARLDFHVGPKDNPLGKIEGPTDTNGNFTAEGPASAGALGGGVTKDGYYRGGADVPPLTRFNDNRWQPWDVTYTTVLCKIGNPIPMYVRKITAKIPGATNEPCGFDLEEADWVVPYGKGKVTDIVITITNVQYRSFNDYEASATITFPNNVDGIQEIHLPKEFVYSTYKWPREAPEAGFLPALIIQRVWLNSPEGNKNINTSNENQTHFFRVRTIKQGDQITSALYGKIKGGFYINPDSSSHCFIEFTYYLNPTPNDRNMEWDPKKNLAPTPTDVAQQVHEP